MNPVKGAPPPRDDAARARVALVTGGSSGIGTETARGLLRLGFQVVVVGRDAQRTRDVSELLSREHSASVDHLVADFSSLRAVDELASEFLERYQRLDVLVNNAGLWHPKRTLSADGYEDTFAVNHLAAFLLTRRLEPILRQTPSARVVTVSSRLHIKVPSFDFSDVMSESHYEGIYVYAKSKLANILFSNQLAKRLKASGGTSNSVHPGSVSTNVVRDSKLLSLGARLPLPFLKNAEQGARTSVFAATAPELNGVTGCYLAPTRPARPFGRQLEPQAHVPSVAARDTQAADQLWRLSEGLVAPFSDLP